MKKNQNQEDEQDLLQPLGSLPEDALLEILSRVPYRSLCRFKCVSKPCLALCSAPDIRKRSPQTLSGFFYNFMFEFCNLSGRGPPMVDTSFPYLHKSYQCVLPRHCCGGLVLCRFSKTPQLEEDEYNLVVCNPATENWIELPPCPIQSLQVDEFLGFDPATPSCFVVFVIFLGESTQQVVIYSFGRWTAVQSGWINAPHHVSLRECVFLNGTMHSLTNTSIITVDSEGKVWRQIDVPGNGPQSCWDILSIGQSQGCLYAWSTDNDWQLSVWALEHYGSAKWTLKHTVNILELFGRHCCKYDEVYDMFAIHPDRNLIFLTDRKKTTISYDMDTQEVHVSGISKELWGVQPYIPCFADWPSDGH